MVEEDRILLAHRYLDKLRDDYSVMVKITLGMVGIGMDAYKWDAEDTHEWVYLCSAAGVNFCKVAEFLYKEVNGLVKP